MKRLLGILGVVGVVGLGVLGPPHHSGHPPGIAIPLGPGVGEVLGDPDHTHEEVYHSPGPEAPVFGHYASATMTNAVLASSTRLTPSPYYEVIGVTVVPARPGHLTLAPYSGFIALPPEGIASIAPMTTDANASPAARRALSVGLMVACVIGASVLGVMRRMAGAHPVSA